MNNSCGSGGGGILTFAYDGIVIDKCSFDTNVALAGAAAYIVRSTKHARRLLLPRRAAAMLGSCIAL